MTQTPSLQEVQQWVKARVRPGLRETAPGQRPVILNLQRGTPGEERLAVYAGGYLARMRESLAETYEAVQHLVGERAFSGLARAYAEQYPSHDYNLSFAGRHLPELLAGDSLSRELPFLPDLAQLEWLVAQAFHAFDGPAFDPRSLAARSVEQAAGLRLLFQPSVGLVASAWPVLDLWGARATPRERINLRVVNRPQQVLVFRQGEHVRCELVAAQEFALLRALREGLALAQALEQLPAQTPDVTARVARWVARWAGAGLIARVA